MKYKKIVKQILMVGIALVPLYNLILLGLGYFRDPSAFDLPDTIGSTTFNITENSTGYNLSWTDKSVIDYAVGTLVQNNHTYSKSSYFGTILGFCYKLNSLVGIPYRATFIPCIYFYYYSIVEFIDLLFEFVFLIPESIKKWVEGFSL